MNDIFYKPYLSEKTAVFPYPKEVLLERSIFPAVVCDCGAFLFAKDVFNISNGDDMLEKTMDGSLFEYYKNNGEFDWSAVEKRFKSAEYTPEWEGHIWIFRLYMLFPLAHAYSKTRDKKYSDAYFKIIKHFTESNPYDESVRYKWHDMQLTWRLLGLIYGVYFMGDSDALNEEQWNFVYDLIKIHINGMMKETEIWLSKDNPFYTNHMIQKAAVLIYAGVLLPELCDSEKIITLAKEVLEKHIEGEMYPEGINKESGIAYRHFIARHFLDAELLLSKNNMKSIDGLRECVKEQYEFLYQFSTPSGKNVMMGDTYCLNAAEDIELVDSVFPLEFCREKKSHLYKEARHVVQRSGKLELFIDAQEFIPQIADNYATHKHFGHLHFVLYGGEYPLVLDSGCPNYDRAVIKIPLSTEPGHNVIWCEEIPEHKNMMLTEKFFENTEITEFEAGKKCSLKITVSDGKDKSYDWVRIFETEGNTLTITDKVTANGKYHFKSFLHLPPVITGYPDPVNNPPVSEDKKKLCLRIKNSFEYVETETPMELSIAPYFNEDNNIDYCQTATRSFFADSFTEKTVIRFEEN